MPSPTSAHYIAFQGPGVVATGTRQHVRNELIRLSQTVASKAGSMGPVLILDGETAETVDFEWLGFEGTGQPIAGGSASEPAVFESIAPEPIVPSRKPGRPRLGVVAREITLLPRHWEWLESQPGGASVALRKLVETARKERAPEDRIRRSIEAAYRFLSVMSGYVPNFESVARALFRREWKEFDRLTQELPGDIGDHLRKLTAAARPQQPGNAEH